MVRHIPLAILASIASVLTVGCADVTPRDLSHPPLCDQFTSTCNVRDIAEFDLVIGTKYRREIRSGSRVITSSSMVISQASQSRLNSVFASAEFRSMIERPHSFFIIGVEPVLLACVPVEYSPTADDMMLTDQAALHYNSSLAEWYVFSARFPACNEVILVGPDQPAELVAMDPSGSTVWSSAAVDGRIEFRRAGEFIVATPVSASRRGDARDDAGAGVRPRESSRSPPASETRP